MNPEYINICHSSQKLNKGSLQHLTSFLPTATQASLRRSNKAWKSFIDTDPTWLLARNTSREQAMTHISEMKELIKLKDDITTKTAWLTAKGYMQGNLPASELSVLKRGNAALEQIKKLNYNDPLSTKMLTSLKYAQIGIICRVQIDYKQNEARMNNASLLTKIPLWVLHNLNVLSLPFSFSVTIHPLSHLLLNGQYPNEFKIICKSDLIRAIALAISAALSIVACLDFFHRITLNIQDRLDNSRFNYQILKDLAPIVPFNISLITFAVLVFYTT